MTLSLRRRVIAAIALAGLSSAVALSAESTESSSELPTEISTPDQSGANAVLVRKGGLSPEESLARMETPSDLRVEDVLHEPQVLQPMFIDFDERGRMWVVEYRQYPDPAGLKEVSRDSVWRTVYDKAPPPPPHHFVGADRISIHQDVDGDGSFDLHKTFLEGLNIVTSAAQGRGGVWVLNPPYLLFYPDRNRDDVPDADPEVHLAGFGLEDTHSVCNSLRWGPDGWLYACQGSTVTGHVAKPGSPDAPIHSMGQAIWRYHPERRLYEIFAEGGGNAFGLEIDAQGRIFSGHNGGDTRGFHYVQGAYLQKGFDKHGPLSNPFAFGYFPAMRHNQVERFTHTFVVYEGGALPARYNGQLFCANPMNNCVVTSERSPFGSTFETQDVGHLITTPDAWCRPVDVKVGPDGAVYVVDFYEEHPSHREHHVGLIDRGSGRVYRVRAQIPQGNDYFASTLAKEAPAQGGEGLDRVRGRSWTDLAALTTDELIDLLTHRNKWFRQTALRILGDRRDEMAIPRLRKELRQKALPSDVDAREANSSRANGALEALWALAISGGLTDEAALELLDHPDPLVREWTVRLLGDEKQVSSPIAARLATLAAEESEIHVRSQLACTAKRLPPRDALPMIDRLLARDADADDPRQGLLLWWALEAKVAEEPEAVLALFKNGDFWRRRIVSETVTEHLMRRFAASGSRADLVICARLLSMAPSDDHVRKLLSGFELATSGRTLVGAPSELTDALARFADESVVLGLRQGRAEALAEAIAAIEDPNADKTKQLTYVQILGEVESSAALPVLLALVRDSTDGALRTAAFGALQRYRDPAIAAATIAAYPKLTDDERSAALQLLAARPESTLQLLDAVDAGAIDTRTIPEAIVRRLERHNVPTIGQRVRNRWGELKPLAPAAVDAEIARLQSVVNAGAGVPKPGKALFGQICGKCHRLFGEGGDVGPDLTSHHRDNLRNMLLHVIQPSAEIREGYKQHIVHTDDGRVLAGVVIEQDPQMIVLRESDGRLAAVARASVEELIASPLSLMPEGLLKDFDDQKIRDLFAYLRTTQPLID